MIPRVHRVRERIQEQGDSVTLVIEPTDGEWKPFESGQFNMLWAFGVGEVPISISGDPSEPGRVYHTIHDVGAATHALCSLTPGEELGVRGPFGRPWDVNAAKGRDVVLLAGGIGLAPLRPVVYEMLARRAEFGHIALLVGARTPGDLLFPDELKAWRERGDIQVETTVDRYELGWSGHVGVVTTLMPLVAGDMAQTMGFVCGPEIMMRFGARSLMDRGVSEDDIQVSLERNMQCAVEQCGHCQFGEFFVCSDGPVFRWGRVAPMVGVREL